MPFASRTTSLRNCGSFQAFSMSRVSISRRVFTVAADAIDSISFPHSRFLRCKRVGSLLSCRASIQQSLDVPGADPPMGHRQIGLGLERRLRVQDELHVMQPADESAMYSAFNEA